MATEAELEALKLTGPKWADQQLQPLDPLEPTVTVPYPAENTWPWKLLPDQIDNVRDAINGLLSLAKKTVPIEQSFTDSDEWQFEHNRDGFPSVVCTDAAGRSLIGGNPDYTTRNSVIVRFNSPQTGVMRIS